MQRMEEARPIRGQILDLLAQRGMREPCYAGLLDLTIRLFEERGLGADYYGYHNVTHELEVAYVALLAAGAAADGVGARDLAHIYMAALLHDFDPAKSVDKPHEEEVLRFVDGDARIRGMMAEAGADPRAVRALILATAYPMDAAAGRRLEDGLAWAGEGEAARLRGMGRYLSVADRVAGYAMGGPARGMELAKMNAHALAWRPSVIVRRSVEYFEQLLGPEAPVSNAVLGRLPGRMRRNFFATVQRFMEIRQKEISVQEGHVHGSLRLVPCIEGAAARRDPAFEAAVRDIHAELPRPLRFGDARFAESLADPRTIVTTLRVGGRGGEIVGFAKGGPLEGYELGPCIDDKNRGLGNTVFLEPLALKVGYWGIRGGSEMRHMFVMQASSMGYEYLTSFALRDVIERRVGREGAEFVARFDPERWDYYRIRI